MRVLFMFCSWGLIAYLLGPLRRGPVRGMYNQFPLQLGSLLTRFFPGLQTLSEDQHGYFIPVRVRTIKNSLSLSFLTILATAMAYRLLRSPILH